MRPFVSGSFELVSVALGSLELLLQWNTFILFICRLEAKPNRTDSGAEGPIMP